MAAYGHHVLPKNDPYIYIVDVATQMTSESGAPGGTLVDFFPFCMSFSFIKYGK